MTIPVEVRFEVEELYNSYCEALDDGPLERWPELFADPCDYQIIPRENFDNTLPLALMRCESRGMLMDRVTAVKEQLMFEPRYLRHMVTNIRIRSVSDDQTRVTVVANYAVLETLRDALTRVLNAGRYFDELVRGEKGALQFKSKHCVFDSELVPNSIVFPV